MTTAAAALPIARLESLEKRIQLLEDTEKIRECLCRYGYNADLGRSQEYVDNYTDDGVIDLAPDRKYVGKDALLYEFITDPNSHKRIENRSLHTSVNTFIRVSGNTAWAEGYSIVFVREGEGYKVFTCGYNHWDFAKKGERWHLKYRYRRPVGGDEWGGKVIKAYLKG